jgi:RNA polymerase sigma-70 factor, ECF subfamily
LAGETQLSINGRIGSESTRGVRPRKPNQYVITSMVESWILNSRKNLLLAPSLGHILVSRKSGWRFLAFSVSRRGATRCLLRARRIRSALDSQACAGHDARVEAPKTKTLGDVLYADKAKLRVSEDEWLRLLRAIADGDQCALHSLYDQTYRIVFTLIVRITMNRETAEEVTLDVFYDVWRNASTYDPANGSLVGWIMNQARSRAIDRLRFDQRKKRVNIYPHSLGPTTDMVNPQQACLFEEQSRLLRDALKLLSTEERKVIETAFFSELTYEQTANNLNQPLGTVKTRIRSGLGKLREALGMEVRR